MINDNLVRTTIISQAELFDNLCLGLVSAHEIICPYALTYWGAIDSQQSNENANSLLREFSPKDTDFAQITDKELTHSLHLINHRI
ncbi:hypothetical protein D3C74_145160 [compost metagenome]